MDRARETLFNWLASEITGARCLDLFAGSGALGFEALSRGADHATFVDQNPAIIRALRTNQEMLGITSAADTTAFNVVKASAPDWLRKQKVRWDIIFLDPPFDSTLLDQTLHILKNGLHTSENALVYVETPSALAIEEATWQLIKETRVGATYLTLLSLKPGLNA